MYSYLSTITSRKYLYSVLGGEKVVILEAAILLEAGWESMVYEVWVTIIPPTEVVPSNLLFVKPFSAVNLFSLKLDGNSVKSYWRSTGSLDDQVPAY